MQAIIWLAAALICAVLYRLGGIGKPFNTKVRDLGCPAIFTAYLLIIWRPESALGWVMLIPAFGLMFGALTTYWDFITGNDNFWLHGFAIGLATFPLFWAGIHWWAIASYSLALAVGMGAWSKAIGWDTLEEGGRGFLICACAPILII